MSLRCRHSNVVCTHNSQTLLGLGGELRCHGMIYNCCYNTHIQGWRPSLPDLARSGGGATPPFLFRIVTYMTYPLHRIRTPWSVRAHKSRSCQVLHHTHNCIVVRWFSFWVMCFARGSGDISGTHSLVATKRTILCNQHVCMTLVPLVVTKCTLDMTVCFFFTYTLRVLKALLTHHAIIGLMPYPLWRVGMLTHII
jgi:hypothetical protein